MKIGVVERILERRRIAAAADLAERYRGHRPDEQPRGCGASGSALSVLRMRETLEQHRRQDVLASSPCCRGDGTVRCASTGWMTTAQ